MITLCPIFKYLRQEQNFGGEGGHLEPVDFLYYFTLSNNWLLTPASRLLKMECLLLLAFLIWFLQNCAISCCFSYGNLAKFCFEGGSPVALTAPPSLPIAFDSSSPLWEHFVLAHKEQLFKSASCYLGPISINKYLWSAVTAPRPS